MEFSIHKLSIITVNLNNIGGLQKTFESVFNQLFSDYEYIVIDGGSTDGSVDIIAQNAIKISYWISERDNGIYHAMNKGIQVSKGEYILFLNSGDSFVDNNVLKNIFKEENVEDILWGVNLLSRNGHVVDKSPSPEKLTLKFFYKQTLPHQSTFIKRSLFKKYGIYEESLKIHADFDFWIRTIVLNNCTTKRLNVLVTIYNLEGISSNQTNFELAKNEYSVILTKNIPARILIDYETWSIEYQQMQHLYWLKSKRYLNSFLSISYKVAVKIFTLKNRLSNKLRTASSNDLINTNNYFS